jgi:hypothetical protein
MEFLSYFRREIPEVEMHFELKDALLRAPELN